MYITFKLGFQAIYFNENNIHLLNKYRSDAQSQCMADFTIGLLIAIARIHQANTNNIKKFDINYKWFPLQGCRSEISNSTVGLFGFGKYYECQYQQRGTKK